MSDEIEEFIKEIAAKHGHRRFARRPYSRSANNQQTIDGRQFEGPTDTT